MKAVHCHFLLPGHDCHNLRFSFVRNVNIFTRVSKYTIPVDFVSLSALLGTQVLQPTCYRTFVAVGEPDYLLGCFLNGLVLVNVLSLSLSGHVKCLTWVGIDLSQTQWGQLESFDKN